MFQPQNKQKDFRISNIFNGGNSSKICRTFYDQNLERAGNYHRRCEERRKKRRAFHEFLIIITRRDDESEETVILRAMWVCFEERWVEFSQGENMLDQNIIILWLRKLSPNRRHETRAVKKGLEHNRCNYGNCELTLSSTLSETSFLSHSII